MGVASKGDFGRESEEYVARHVAAMGWSILERNYHSRFGEIDIIASDREEIVFIEVKARRNDAFGAPLESVTAGKMAKIEATAHAYLFSKGWEELLWRVDVFAVTQKSGTWSVDHLPNFG